MKNVYDQVQVYYEEEIEWEPVVPREWIEGFLRQKAWQGANDRELTELWSHLVMFLDYVEYTGADQLDELTTEEYRLSIHWMANEKNFKATHRRVKRLFEVLLEFYRYLEGRRLVTDIEELEIAAHMVAGGEQLNLGSAETDPEVLDAELEKVLHAVHHIMPEDVVRVIGETVERLIGKLGVYFQQQTFNDDFQRALFLYNGPFETMPEEDSEFWLGFWDYFLFDYHLLENDMTPISHFKDHYGGKLSAGETQVLGDLAQAEFTVFYVDKIAGQDLVECVNLFTDETFQLPYPNFDYKTLKRMVFFGHVFSRTTVVVNYVTSVEVSPNLRRRMKDEIVKLKEIYAVQIPDGSWRDFLARHALGVRHIIDILVNRTAVNVTPIDWTQQDYPQQIEQHAPDANVVACFSQVMPDYGFSFHDIQLANKMWYDFYQINPVMVRKPAVWAAGIIYSYAQVNAPDGLPAEDIARDFAISTASVYTYKTKLFETLKLRKYDPRYLSEEGLLFFLFSLFTI